jgi:hypothetical protein
MIVLENQDIHAAVLTLMESLRKQGKSLETLKTYETSFNSFERYVTKTGIVRIDERVCLDYIHLKTGKRFDSFECVTSNSRVDYRM